MTSPVTSPGPRQNLRADCARCVALCCVAPAFAASSDFAIDKPAGEPCPNLLADSRCSIHAHLRERGFAGCTVFDCLGAGQQVTQVTFGGRDWREPDALARLDVGPHRERVSTVLLCASGLARAGAARPGRELRGADLAGKRLRGADVRGADLSTSLFLTPVQVASAGGDRSTRLPAGLTAPPHWPMHGEPPDA